MIFLTNPSKGGTMARRKLPPRGKNGRFLKRGRKASTKRRRKNPGRSTTKTRRRTTAKRRRTTTPRKRTTRRRRNPPRMKIGKKIQQGVTDAAGIVVGKAAARAIPETFNLPKEGPVGLAVQAGVAVLAGIAAEKVAGRNVARMVLAGGLTAPLESFVAGAGIPFLSPALQPVGSYVGRLGRGRVNGYVMPSPAASIPAGGRPRTLGAYVDGGYDFAAM